MLSDFNLFVWELYFICIIFFNKFLVCMLGGCLLCWYYVLVFVLWGFCVNFVNDMVWEVSLKCERC